MSYILDALKKSDQQRQQHQGPTLQTVQHSPIGQSRTQSVQWLLLVIVLLLLLCAGLGAWYLMANRTSTTTSPAVAIPPVPETIDVITAADPSTPATSASVSLPASGETQAPLASEPVTPAPSQIAVVELWDLPDSVQDQIPALTFSFHVYSENPERRTIIINNRRVKQGDTVLQGLLLEEITQQGIILEWQSSYRFSINVVDNW